MAGSAVASTLTSPRAAGDAVPKDTSGYRREPPEEAGAPAFKGTGCFKRGMGNFCLSCVLPSFRAIRRGRANRHSCLPEPQPQPSAPLARRMKLAAALLLAALAGLAAAGVQHHPLSDAAIEHINSFQSTWQVSAATRSDLFSKSSIAPESYAS